LKTTVPIWKKEFFAGGAVWSEGEPLREPAKSTTDESNH
jgi:molybdopterin synthase catalytic subunit